MLLIDNEVVAKTLTMKECIEAQEAAFEGLLDGRAIFRPRIDTFVPNDAQGGGYYRFGSVEGASHGVVAVRLKSDVMVWQHNPDGSRSNEQKYCMEPGTYCGLVFLFSTENGEPLALMNDGHLQHMRVGGAAGIGTRLLAREDAHTLGIIGSGGMARTFLEAIAVVRKIDYVRVYSRNPVNRERFAREMSEQMGIKIDVVDTPEAALKGMDIVATCTDSSTPVLKAEWLEPGQHVVALTPREFDASVAARFDVVVQQGRETLPMPESERFSQRISASPNSFICGNEEEMKRLPMAAKEKKLSTDDWPVYIDIKSGRRPGRTDPKQITFYYTFGNWGVQFSSVGSVVYRRAKEMGLGRALPTEWFLQDIRN